MIDEEELARELCQLGGFDPNEIMANDGPRWKYYAPQARAAIAYIVPKVRDAVLEDAARYIEGAGGVIPGTTGFVSLIIGHNQPDMSGDSRNRLMPHKRRMFDDASRDLAAAIRNMKDTQP